MKNLNFVLLLIFFISFNASASNCLKAFFKRSDTFLKRNVKDNKVDYENILERPKRFQKLIDMIAEMDLSECSEASKKAFYINCYNLLVIDHVLDNYPIRSPYLINGFFTDKKYLVAGDSLSLNEIEEEKLLVQFNDVRVLFSLCNGTMGAFPLANFAFRPERLERQLDARIKACVNDEKFVRLKKNSKKILVSESFIRCSRLHGEDALIKKINDHREEEIPFTYFLDFYPMNRSLNAVIAEK